MKNKKTDNDEIIATHEIIFDENFNDIMLRTKTNKPIDFEDYKSIIYELIKDCDEEGKDLFCMTNGDKIVLM